MRLLNYIQFHFTQICVLFPYRSLLVCALVGLFILVICQLFAASLHVLENFPIMKSQHQTLIAALEPALSSTPEVWLGLFALVLGTLIIVISIASQSTPKIIDIYMQDWCSLFYLWFMVLGLFQNLSLSDSTHGRLLKYLFVNTRVFLPLAIILTIPYIFYILRYTKPDNVIEHIHSENIRFLQFLIHPITVRRLTKSERIADYQRRLFDSLNQLDDLLTYVSFKEPQSAIIANIGEAIREYIRIKPGFEPRFFEVGQQIRGDISFLTLVGQFEQIKETHSFYEQKGLRLLNDAYIRLIERGNFDLASQCVAEVVKVGRSAVVANSSTLIEIIIIQMNTMLRFGLKHGYRHAERRNVYNAIFHYSQFIHILMDYQQMAYVKECCYYLFVYGAEIYRTSQAPRSLLFLVDVFAAEMRQILIRIAEMDWPLDIQEDILQLMLQMDQPPDTDTETYEKHKKTRRGVRTIQISLALYYERIENQTLVNMILADLMEDLHFFDPDTLLQRVQNACQEMKNASPTFWENTDRGNVNIYYSPDKEFIPRFIKRFEQHLSRQLASPLDN